MSNLLLPLNNVNVCFLTHRFWPCTTGISLSATRITEYFASAGARVHVIVPDFVSDGERIIMPSRMAQILDQRELKSSGVYIYRVPVLMRRGRVSTSLWPILDEFLGQLCSEVEFDIFHGFGLPLAYPALIHAAKKARPVLASIRGADGLSLLGSPESLAVMKTILMKADWVTSVASDLLTNVNAIESTAGRDSVIFNGIDCDNFPRWSATESEKGVVGTAGIHRYKKGTAFLVQAYAGVPVAIRKNLKLLGRYEDLLEQEKVLDIVNVNQLHQEVVQSAELSRESMLNSIVRWNAFALPSLHDGMPNALLEAAGCGIPIVASAVGGMADVLTNQENALIVAPGNVKELTCALTSVLSDEALCKSLSRGAYQLSKEFSTAKEKKQWLDLYLDLL